MKKNLSYLACGVMGLMLSAPMQASTFASMETMEVAAEAARKIVNVETINVEAPEGTVPRLPFQVWVTYSDGTAAYRQTKWSNAALAAEQELAKYPVGKKYQLEGFITGDNTTANCFTIVANITFI